MRVIKLLFVIFICVSNVTVAQQYNVRQFTTKHGLPNNIVNSVCEDHLGRIWFATQNGICYFDGKKFITFENFSDLRGVDAKQIIQDKNRKYWIATIGQGLILYNNSSFKIYTEKDGLPANEIQVLFCDNSGKIWIGTKNGLAFFENEKFIDVVDDRNLFKSKHYPRTIAQTKNGEIWVGTWGGGLVKISNQKFTYYGLEDGIEDEWISTLTAVNDTLYIGTSEAGIVLHTNSKFEKLLLPNHEKSWINAIIYKQGNVVALTDTDVIKISNKKSIVLNESNGLLNNVQYAGIYDKYDNLWLASDFGISCLKKENIYSFTDRNGLSSPKTSSVYISKLGEALVGTTGYGFNLLSLNYNKAPINISHNSVENQTIKCFAEIKNELWVGTEFGITIFNRENDTYKYSKSINTILGSSVEEVNKIILDKKGDVWISSYYKGVYNIKGNDTIQFNKEKGLPSNEVLSIHCDFNGTIWISINQFGLFKFDGTLFKEHLISKEIFDYTVYSISEDKKGNLYFGNKSNGLTVFNGEKHYNFTQKDGLLSNLLHAIVFDDHDNCWIGTDKGINKITFENDFKISSIISLNASNGLITEEVNQNALVFDGTKMWAATNEGLYVLDTDVEVDKNIRPFIVSKGIKLFFDAVDWSQKGIKSFDELGNPTYLELNYLDNHLTFEYNCITLNDVKYSYILEGFDSDWSPWTDKNEVLYSNIPPGNYNFKVKAVDSYGVESKNILTVEITINPPYWQTWWFRISILILLGILIYGIFKWRTKALLERQQELEQQVEERTAEVVLQKNKAEEQRHLVEEKNKEISDSINYAERIQRSLLANEQMLSSYLKEYFIFFQPKDVVSGDFYWASPLTNGNLAIVNADSTGHGVPGAIMSMLNMNSLKESVTGMGLIEPHEILNNTRKIIKNTLANDGSAEGGKDGMDCSIVCFDFTHNKIEFAAANNPVWIFRNEELIEFKPDKMPVGKHDRDSESFTKQTFEIQKRDIIYTLTDGMPDQFGGPKGKKYMYKALKELLIQIAPLSMEEQKSKLVTEFNNWKNDQEQVDDVCIIGIRI